MKNLRDEMLSHYWKYQYFCHNGSIALHVLLKARLLLVLMLKLCNLAVVKGKQILLASKRRRPKTFNKLVKFYVNIPSRFCEIDNRPQEATFFCRTPYKYVYSSVLCNRKYYI